MQAASRSLALQIHVLNASSSDEIDEAFATLAQRGIGALVVTADSFFNSRSQQLAALVLRYALPAITAHREFTVAGGPYHTGVFWNSILGSMCSSVSTSSTSVSGPVMRYVP